MIHIGGHRDEINIEFSTRDLIKIIQSTKTLSYETNSGFVSYHFP